MGLARYFVLCRDNEWLVTLEGRIMGRYRARRNAVQSAIVMADLMGAMHHDADVMVERSPGLPLELAWTYGVDPVPARRAPRPSHVRRVQHGAADHVS